MRARLERITKLLFIAGAASAFAFAGCAGEDGADGTNGVDGTSCTVTDNGDGTTTIACDDGTTATVSNGEDGNNGTNGADGDSCTVTDNGDGTKTVACDDGTTATIVDGADGGSCSVTDNGDGTTTIACDDGTTATVADGEDVDPATLDDIQAQLDELAAAGPESCTVCHKDAGMHHQAVYDRYDDASRIAMTIIDVVSTDNGDNTYDAVMTFDITWMGMRYEDANGLPGLDQKRFYTVRWDGTKYVDSKSFGSIMATATPGRYTASADGMSYAPENSDAAVYGYLAVTSLPTEPPAGHVHLYDDVFNAGLIYGNAGVYESTANVEGCEKCHGAPYMKHGYRGAEATNLPDFVACKTCHYDDRNGGHIDWQILVDDPVRYAELHAGADTTAAEDAKYAYVANVMNDTHMSHAMEFPYPQSMANCVTCHEGKLDRILTDANFKISTCKSCHPMTGSEEYGTADLALETLWGDAGYNHAETDTCNNCHKAGSNTPDFKAIHSGYNRVIFFDEGVKYAELFTVTIDDASVTDNVMTIKFSAHEVAGSTATMQASDIVPTLLVGLYGYDTKDFIVGPHERDENSNRLLEMVIDGEATNPRFTVVSSANGDFEVDIDISMWEDLMVDGVVLRAEIAVEPELRDANDTRLALNAVSRTFDFASDDFDDDYFDDIVDVQNCNNCHEALATTFHSPNRGGSIRTCRLCHITKNGGSHLEMQSRSLDSYVHAIHSFQDYDPGDIDFTDPVEKLRYEMHIEHGYPNFTILNCESCHNPGMYDVPKQNKSLGGLLSKSDAVADREIQNVPAYVTGPASRACGGCHRAEYINEDDFNGLVAFNQHMKQNGYLIEDADGMVLMAIETIMSMF